LAEPTGFEPATSDVTGRRSNQLNYDSASNFKASQKARLKCCDLSCGQGQAINATRSVYPGGRWTVHRQSALRAPFSICTAQSFNRSIYASPGFFNHFSRVVAGQGFQELNKLGLFLFGKVHGLKFPVPIRVSVAALDVKLDHFR
jgi:hypothetical protein